MYVYMCVTANEGVKCEWILMKNVAFCRGSSGVLVATATAWRRIEGLGHSLFAANVNLLDFAFIASFL